MPAQNRTYNIGRLSELKMQRETLRIEIDAQVKAILVHFEPVEQDLVYVDKIIPDRLKTYVNTIDRKKKMLDRVNTEISHLADELAEPRD